MPAEFHTLKKKDAKAFVAKFKELGLE